MPTVTMFGSLRNFTAAARKYVLIPFGYFSPNDNIAWIEGPGYSLQAQPSLLTGTLDGINRAFTVSQAISNFCQIYRNGVMQAAGVHYTLSGQIVTFLDPYVPQPGDYLLAMVE